MRKILFITGIRSDFYLQLPIIKLAQKDKKIKLVLVVTGAHLEKKFGNTLKDINNLKIKINYKIRNLEFHKDEPVERLIAFYNQIKKLTKIVSKEKPDIILSPFDREEALSSAIVGKYMNIPVAHLGAGDYTRFNIDGVIRDAVSKLSNILFCSNETSKKKLIKIGEDSKRIFNYGSTAFDRYFLTEKIHKKKLEKRFKISIDAGLIISIFHPVSDDIRQSIKDLKNLLSALDKFNKPTIIIKPNSDPGNYQLRKLINKFKPKINKNFRVFDNIEENYFVNLLRHTNLIIGNSSMGIYESAFLKIPAINVGQRQKGRKSNNNIFFIKSKETKILSSLKECFVSKKLKFKKNIFFKSNTSKNILKKLKQINLNKKLINKNYAI